MRKTIKLSDIVTDAGTQVRASINDDTVAEYAEAFKAGAKFPPVDVFSDGNKYLLADGFHRYMGASRAGVKEIEATIHPGTRSDCIKFALGCNVSHGLRRTNADKRRAVEMALAEWPKLSNGAISDICSVSHPFVGDIRREAQPETDSGSPIEKPRKTDVLPVPETRIGRDGKERKLPPPPPAKPVPPTPPPAPPKAPPPPPPRREEPKILDKTGFAIPAKVLPLWQEATGVQTLLSAISSMRGALRKAQEGGDKIFAEVNFSTALASLDQAYTSIKTALPHAVCTQCQGQMPDKCTLCKGRGFISEHRWDTCVPRETKEIRFKARK